MFNPAQPVALSAGWNWVSFLPQTSLSLASGMSSLLPVIQQVKSQTQSALFSEGQWRGDLTQLEPGKGYLIRLSGAGTLSFPAP